MTFCYRTNKEFKHFLNHLYATNVSLKWLKLSAASMPLLMPFFTFLTECLDEVAVSVYLGHFPWQIYIIHRGKDGPAPLSQTVPIIIHVQRLSCLWCVSEAVLDWQGSVIIPKVQEHSLEHSHQLTYLWFGYGRVLGLH